MIYETGYNCKMENKNSLFSQNENSGKMFNMALMSSSTDVRPAPKLRAQCQNRCVTLVDKLDLSIKRYNKAMIRKWRNQKEIRILFM